MKKLLIVEDDPGLQKQLRWAFDGYEVLTAEDRASALAQVRRHQPAVITLDLGLPPDRENASEGLLALQEIISAAPDAKVIVVTGNDDRSNAVRAIGLGAYDFYQKPVEPEILRLIVERAHHVAALEQENRQLSQQANQSPLDGVVAASPQMLKACRTLERVAPTSATVLVLGESGTGKELFARAVHGLSSRAKKRFVAINCAAIPETLLESELFGYEKGAFTGAVKQTIGKIECATGGTLFLDEIGDLPMALQAKLLRFLQERVIERVGGREEIPVDVRVICATHRDLARLIQEGAFREDLYYRISELSIEIPPLRDRVGDPVLLARVFLDEFAKEHKRSLRGFTKDALAALENYAWPGNVRELENRIKRAVILAEGNQITAEDLNFTAAEAGEADRPLGLREVRERAEREAVVRALGLANGKIAPAAELLGVTRPTLYDLLNRFGLKA